MEKKKKHIQLNREKEVEGFEFKIQIHIYQWMERWMIYNEEREREKELYAI